MALFINLDHWHTGCKSHPRREATKHRIKVEQTNLMKANTTKNLASVVMLVILSPFLALAVLVSIKSAGIRNNEVLLLLLTLSSAVLSGINGFGRRTATAVQLSPAKAGSRGGNPSGANVTFAGSPSNNA
ncbi:MAG TPA: hypothetical protein VGJ37_17150 [Pyrinomonadaceae bacterium]|jgi:hypothetical protein